MGGSGKDAVCTRRDDLANLCAQGAEAQIERINQFDVYEQALISHIQGAIQVPQVHVPAPQVTVQTRAEQGNR